jgi:hypothetical protein
MILALIFAIGANVISLLSQKAFMVPGSANRPHPNSLRRFSRRTTSVARYPTSGSPSKLGAQGSGWGMGTRLAARAASVWA